MDTYDASPVPTPYYEYSTPNYRPPIESKPIVHKHEIVSVPAPHRGHLHGHEHGLHEPGYHHQEHHGGYHQKQYEDHKQEQHGTYSEESHDPPNQGGYRHTHRDRKSLSVLDKYLHPVQYVQLQAPVIHSSGPSYPTQSSLFTAGPPNTASVSNIIKDPFIYEISPFYQPQHNLGHQIREKKKTKRHILKIN